VGVNDNSPLALNPPPTPPRSRPRPPGGRPAAARVPPSRIVTSQLADYQWLTSPAGRQWLDRAASLCGSLTAATEALRKHLSPQRTHLVLEQLELRKRARDKFSQADAMFFTRRGLEQATDGRIATYKAGRFAHREVDDLCCGVGGDLVGLARRGPARGVDRDPLLAHLARENSVVLATNAATVCADAITTAVRGDPEAPWHIDPDRRAAGRRTTRIESFEPAADKIEQVLACRPHGAFKLAPATQPPARWRHNAELEWIGHRRACQQQVVWFGDLAQQPGAVTATVLGGIAADPSNDASRAPGEGFAQLSGQPGEHPPVDNHLRAFLMEPHAAVLAADLMGELARQHGLAAISPGAAWLTGDEPVASPLVSTYEIMDCLPPDRKKLRKCLRQRGIEHLTVKTRGVSHRPRHVLRELGVKEAPEPVLILTRRGHEHLAVLARAWERAG